MTNTRFEQRLITALEPTHERALMMRHCNAAFRSIAKTLCKQQFAHRRRHRQCNRKRREDRNNVGNAKRLKEPTFKPLQEEQRHEDDADDDRGNDDR